MNTKFVPLMNLEFIKLAKAMREAQKEARYSQRMARRAQSLEQLFDAKIEAYERQITETLEELEQKIGAGDQP